MATYTIRRCLQAVVILAGLTVIFFGILNAQPGGPCVYILANPKAGADVHTAYERCLIARGLNKSIPERYWIWLSGVTHGDFGTDFTGRPVIDTLKLRLPATLILLGVAYIFQELLALPLGMLGALKRYSLYDHLLTFCSYVGLSLPTFWLGLMLILLLAIKLSIFPPGGIITPSFPVSFGTGDYWPWLFSHFGTGIADLFAHLTLPALTLAIVGIAADSRFMRASMLDAINQDYVRTARAKGLPRHKVVLKHTLRNALLPIITNVGLYLGTIVSGAIITETIFGWPGMGKYFIDALNNQDSNAMQAVLLLTALTVLLFNLLADLTYAWADPRIRYD
jgi:peptide/nickel transport system permease protein